MRVVVPVYTVTKLYSWLLTSYKANLNLVGVTQEEVQPVHLLSDLRNRVERCANPILTMWPDR